MLLHRLSAAGDNKRVDLLVAQGAGDLDVWVQTVLPSCSSLPHPQRGGITKLTVKSSIIRALAYEQVEEGREGTRGEDGGVQQSQRTMGGRVQGYAGVKGWTAEGDGGKTGGRRRRSVDPAFAVSGCHLFTHSTLLPRSQKGHDYTRPHLWGTFNIGKSVQIWLLFYFFNYYYFGYLLTKIKIIV